MTVGENMRLDLRPCFWTGSVLWIRKRSLVYLLFCSGRISCSPAADLEQQKRYHRQPLLQEGRAGPPLIPGLQQSLTCGQWLLRSCLCESSCGGQEPLYRSLIQAFDFFLFCFFSLFGAKDSVPVCQLPDSSGGGAHTHTRRKRNGSSRVWLDGPRQRAGVPASEHGQGGSLGVAEWARSLAAVQRRRLPPHWERAERGCPGKCGPGASGWPALSLRHRSAVYAPVSTGHR